MPIMPNLFRHWLLFPVPTIDEIQRPIAAELKAFEPHFREAMRSKTHAPVELLERETLEPGRPQRVRRASAQHPYPQHVAAVLAGLAALCLGAVMAFCGAYFALRKS